LAMILIIVIAGILAWGTFYEVRFGTEAVQRFVYRSGWFQAILIFLALNLVMAALQRWPWKRHHIPFLLAHLGVITILLGGVVSSRWGVEGKLIIEEGQAQSSLRMPTQVLAARLANPGWLKEFPVHFETMAWNHRPNRSFWVPVSERPFVIRVDRYYPNADWKEEVHPDGVNENPAIRLTVAYEGEEDVGWLFSRDPERSSAQWGNIHLFFIEPQSQQELEEFLKILGPSLNRFPRGVVRFSFLNEAVECEVPVAAEMDEVIPIEGTPYRLVFKDYFNDFFLSPHGPVNRSSHPNNPAVAFLLMGPEGTDPHLAFARYPDFAAIHGKDQKIPVRIRYLHPAVHGFPEDSIVLVRLPSGALIGVMQGGVGELEFLDPIELQVEYRHPRLGYRFRLEEIFPRAKRVIRYVNRSNEIRRQVVHAVVEQDGSEVWEGWIPLGEGRTIPMGQPDDPLILEYRWAQHPLPFSVKLIDFRKEDHPGTRIAASFESDVEIDDPERGLTLRRTIAMNRPLRYRGYTLFQSGYVEGPVESTILSVRNDPGTPVMYAGFLAVLLGVVGLFWSRRRMANGLGANLAVGFLVATTFFATPLAHAKSDPDWVEIPPSVLKQLKTLPIQHNGRVKPFDSFAWETLNRLSGQPRWGGRPPVETIWSMVAYPASWQKVEILSVPFVPLRKALGLSPKTTHVSYNRLVEDRALMRMLPGIIRKQRDGERLTFLENEALELYDRFVAITELFQQRLPLVPPSEKESTWWPITDPQAYPLAQQETLRRVWETWMTSLRRKDPEAIATSACALLGELKALHPSRYPPRWRLSLEVAYNDLAPFHVAVWFYGWAVLLGAVGLVWRGKRKGLGWITAILMGWGFIFHAGGLIVRIVLAGRPPVANFYETTLWLPLVAVVLAWMFAWIDRSVVFLLAGSVAAFGMLLFGEWMPLDPSVGPIVAVLRSPMWLTVHVLTVVASYAPLTLAAILAHLYAGLYLVRGSGHPTLAAWALFQYRAIQVGVALLTLGIVLGAIWANASWGRYWGWDPKETWALITLLWYVGLLHGRYAGWVRGIGLALGAMVGWLLVWMTYYGVSFYLVGLHSYAGASIPPVPSFLKWGLLLDGVFIIWIAGCAILRRRRALHVQHRLA
jgi:ABC-type transport system involved in cytochrome c biogenesis permease subunit